MSAIIQLTFDGSFLHDGHKVSLRVLSHTMSSLQAASDRAFLDVKYGDVSKHQKLPYQYYEEADFIVGDPREGSYLIDFISRNGAAIVRRMKSAITEPYEKSLKGADIQIYQISHQVTGKKEQIKRGDIEPIDFEKLSSDQLKLVTRTYGDKSINKEFDRLLSPVRRNDGSFLRLVLKPDADEEAKSFDFDQTIAKNFKNIISKRELGDPIIYHGKLRLLDHGHNRRTNLRGKFINVENDKDVVLNIQSKEDFDRLVPYIQSQEVFTIIACPIIEFSSHDPVGGDIQFIEIV